MDKDRIDMALKAISRMSESQFEDAQIQLIIGEERQKDSDAKEQGIDRLCLFTKDANRVLLVKPSPMMNLWQLNMFDHGHISYDGDDVEFSATEIAGELYRLTIKFGQITYWVDLMNEKQLNDACLFLGIDIDRPIKQ